jgi:hypothetical protein
MNLTFTPETIETELLEISFRALERAARIDGVKFSIQVGTDGITVLIVNVEHEHLADLYFELPISGLDISPFLHFPPEEFSEESIEAYRETAKAFRKMADEIEGIADNANIAYFEHLREQRGNLQKALESTQRRISSIETRLRDAPDMVAK